MFAWNPYNPLDRNCGHPEFAEFLKNVIRAFPNGYLNQMYPFFTNRCTHIGKYENLEEHFKKFMEIANEGLDRSFLQDAPPVLVSAQHSNPVKYSLAQATELMKIESLVCDAYNYNLPDDLLD